jgi:hypothetical protein
VTGARRVVDEMLTLTFLCVGLQPALLMPIIQFVLPSKSKHIKKLLQYVHSSPFRTRVRPAAHPRSLPLCSFYWEICPKLDENGKLKQEMILVWYVRFATAEQTL